MLLGNEFLDASISSSSGGIADVVLDLMMPVLDGWGFLEACRHEELCAKTPVLVMSAYRKLAEAAVSELRVDRFLAKPFELDELIEAVEELVA